MHFPGTNVKDKRRIKVLLLRCEFFNRHCVICIDTNVKIIYIIMSSNFFVIVYEYFNMYKNHF